MSCIAWEFVNFNPGSDQGSNIIFDYYVKEATFLKNYFRLWPSDFVKELLHFFSSVSEALFTFFSFHALGNVNILTFLTSSFFFRNVSETFGNLSSPLTPPFYVRSSERCLVTILTQFEYMYVAYCVTL